MCMNTDPLTHAGLFEVVEHPLLKDEPSAMFGLVLASLLRQPSLSLGVEEGLRQTTLTIGNFELFLLDILVEFLCVCEREDLRTDFILASEREGGV